MITCTYHRDAHGDVPDPREFTAAVRAHRHRGKGHAGVLHMTREWLQGEADAGHPEALTDHMWLWQAPRDCGARVEHARAELADELECRIPQLRTLRRICGKWGMSEKSVKVILDSRGDVFRAWVWDDETAHRRLQAYPL